MTTPRKFNAFASNADVLADIRALLYIIADVLAGDEQRNPATDSFTRFVKARMTEQPGEDHEDKDKDHHE